MHKSDLGTPRQVIYREMGIQQREPQRPLQRQRHLAAAEQLHEEDLLAVRRTLGSAHPDALMSARNLGVVRCLRGKWGEGLALLLEAAKGQEKALGPEHPHTQTTWEALRRHEQDFAQHQEEQGRKQEEEEGEETIGQRLAKRRRASGAG